MQTYSLAQVQAFLAAADRLERRRVMHGALASRAGQATESGWKKFCRTFGG